MWISSDLSFDKSVINAFEQKYDFLFPAQYENFLLTYNGGILFDTTFKNKYVETDITQFYNIESIESGFYFMDDLIDGVLKIASNSFGDYFYIGVSEKRYGKIFFRYHDLAKKYIKISEDFHSFIEMCESHKIDHIASIEERKQKQITSGNNKNINDLIPLWEAEINSLNKRKLRQQLLTLPDIDEVLNDENRFLSQQNLKLLNKKKAVIQDFGVWLSHILMYSYYYEYKEFIFHIIKDKKRDNRWNISLQSSDCDETMRHIKAFAWKVYDNQCSIVDDVVIELQNYLENGKCADIFKQSQLISLNAENREAILIYKKEDTDNSLFNITSKILDSITCRNKKIFQEVHSLEYRSIFMNEISLVNIKEHVISILKEKGYIFELNKKLSRNGFFEAFLDLIHGNKYIYSWSINRCWFDGQKNFYQFCQTIQTQLKEYNLCVAVIDIDKNNNYNCVIMSLSRFALVKQLCRDINIKIYDIGEDDLKDIKWRWPFLF